MKLDELFTLFCREKKFLQNSTDKTIIFYKHSWRAFNKAFPILPDTLTRQHLTDFVMHMRERQLSPVSCNVYIRGVNSFLTWLYQSEYLPEHLKIKQLKEEQKVIQTFTEAHLRAIITYKAKSDTQRRLHTLLLLLIDTGIRIDEALTLTKNNVDLDNCLVKVMGKGQKERILPFSIEYRKVLYRFLSKHKFNRVFCTRNGGKLSYYNTLRDFKLLAEGLGITGVRVSFHSVRHTFAKNYVRSGGNIFYLMKQLGHTNLAMSKRYVEVDTEALQEVHVKTSLLSRLR